MRLRPLRAGEMGALRALHDASFNALGAAYDDYASRVPALIPGTAWARRGARRHRRSPSRR